MRNEFLERMLENLPVLHTAAGLTQNQLGKKIGVSRQTIVAIENRKRPLPWYLYLAMMLIFAQNEELNTLLNKLEIFDKNLVV